MSLAPPAVQVLVPRRIEARLPPWGWPEHRLAGPCMGTRWSLRLHAPASLRVPALQARVQAELATVVAEMSHWEPDSALGRYNDAPAGSWHTLPPAFDTVLRAALDLAARSDGAFEPAAGALVNRWGFGPGPRFDAPGFQPPEASEIAALRATGDHRRLRRDAAGRLLQPGGLRLDLSAIAKGHAVDRIADALRAEGHRDGLVEVGGELRGLGLKPSGQPWWVDLAMPSDAPGPPLPAMRLALHGLSVATSGDDQRCFYDAQGRRQSHTLDPRSGRPIAHGLAAVSVVHASCMQADGLATVLMVLGREAGLAWAARQGVAACFTQRLPGGGLCRQPSPAWQELLDDA